MEAKGAPCQLLPDLPRSYYRLYTPRRTSTIIWKSAANARGAGSGPVRSVWKAAPSARSIETAHCDWENDACHCDEVPKPVYCEACRKGILKRERCGEWVCAKHHKWHDDTAIAATEANIYQRGCSKCILYSRKKRDTLVREVERNLLLGAKDRAAPVKDAPKATVVLDRLVRTGQAPMASVVLDFAGGRRDGPRRKAKLRAKKDKTAKVPRKQCALKAQLARLVGGGCSTTWSRSARSGNS